MHHILNLTLGLGFTVLFVWAQGATFPATFPDVSSSTTITTTTTSLSSTVAPSGTSATTDATTTANATSTNSAEFPSLSGYPSCVSECLASSVANAGCNSIVDIDCFCASDRFPLTMFNCISAGCASEVQSAESLAQQFCNVGNFTTLSFPPAMSSTSTTSSTTSTFSAPNSNITTNTTNGAVVGGLAGLTDRGMYASVAMTVFSGILGMYLMD